MSDLIGRKRAQPTKIVGADNTTGDETYYQNVTSLGDAMTIDSPKTTGLHGSLSVTTTPVELKVGAQKLPNRKLVCIQPKGKHVYYGYDNTVSPATGTEVFKNQTLYIPVGDLQSIWLVSDSAAGIDVRILEI